MATQTAGGLYFVCDCLNIHTSTPDVWLNSAFLGELSMSFYHRDLESKKSKFSLILYERYNLLVT